MEKSIEELEARRESLLKEIAKTGDMRRGSVTEAYRVCGKRNCSCHTTNRQGHGPYYAYTTKVAGKTRTLQLRPGPLLSKVEREVETYRRFRALTEDLLEVNQAICNARPVPVPGESDVTALKKTSQRKSGKKSRSR
jgi:hypothetical protein